jgi:hypothetical protein
MGTAGKSNGPSWQAGAHGVSAELLMIAEIRSTLSRIAGLVNLAPVFHTAAHVFRAMAKKTDQSLQISSSRS